MKIVNDWKLLTILAKISIIYVGFSSDLTSGNDVFWLLRSEFIRPQPQEKEKKLGQDLYFYLGYHNQLIFTSSKSAVEALEKGV